MKVRYFEKRGETWADFRLNGDRKRMPTGAIWGDSRAAEAAMPGVIARALQEQQSGANGGIATPNSPRSATVSKSGKTLEAMFKLGMRTRDRWRFAKDKADVEDRYQACAAYWGSERDLADCTREAVMKWRDAMLDSPGRRAGTTLSHSTINHRLSLLSTLLELADLAPHSVKHLSVQQSRRKRRIREDELQAVQAWLTANHQRKGASSFNDLVTACLHTAARQSEWLGLRWPDVYFDRGVVLFRDTKNGEAREAAMSDDVKRMLERRAGYGLEGPFADLTQDRCQDLWQAARRALGLEHDHEFVFHVATRHEGLSRLGDLGASAFEVMAVAGHRNIETSARYVKLRGAGLQLQANRIAGYGKPESEAH